MTGNPSDCVDSAERWQDFLARELACPVRVVLGRSRRTPIQVSPWNPTPEDRPRGSGEAQALLVRMHAMFGDAPDEVLQAVARWMRPGRRSSRADGILDRWISAELERLPPSEARRVLLRPKGECHDLEPIQEELCGREFARVFDAEAGLTRPALTWGRRGKSRTRWSLRLGSFYPEERLIRIHPVLDQAAVPAWFVRYVVFHEHLHAALPPRAGPGGRLVHHSPEFQRREAHYVDYARALAWQEKNLPRLIRSARSGKTMRVMREGRWRGLARTERAAPASESCGIVYRQGKLFG